jgi:DNA recombination protein RmuC
MAALEEDHGLMEYALKEKIILATPANFIALLKTVEYGWRQEVLSDNALEIKNIAEVLHARLGTFFEHIEKLGSAVTSTVVNYNKAVGSLERNVLPQAKKLKKLGVSTKNEITEPMLIDKTTRELNKPKD